MTKFACDVCESVENVSRLSFTVGKSLDEAGSIDYTVEDLDVCNVHIKMLTMYLLNRMTRNGEFREQQDAYKYLQTIARNSKLVKEGL